MTRLRTSLVLLGATLAASAAAPAASHAAVCTPPIVNQIACENSKPGADPNTWQIDGDGDDTIQGFATQMSVKAGDTIGFKIKSATSNYRIDILRIGYYGGNGARLIASNLTPTGTSTQPACLTNSSTGLIDCGNWATSRSWTVPSTAVSGVYIAHLVRNDTGGDSHIKFVVRDDSSTSDMVIQTSDSTWNAYNSYGGNSLYVCTVACPPGDPYTYKAAYKVSYNRPLNTEQLNPRSSFFSGGEYPMVRFAEAMGYDVSYVSNVDVHRRGSTLLNHELFISSGHDEYWSATQRDSMEAARDAGVNLAFFSGNEGYWKTRWEPSVDASATLDRTLVSYKDTHFQSQQDPVSWTGTWTDPRFASAADNVTPQNALTGQLFVVNSGTVDMKVPAEYKALRFWRNTAVANLTSGQTLTLGADTLGYEWDVDADNGFRPPGQFRLSSTTASGLEVFTDYGSETVQNGTKTHNLTMYRAPSGSLVFGAGTVQWSWGLDDANAFGHPVNRTMQQATVNLFADMGAQPYNLLTGLVSASASTDTTRPTATITSPPASVSDGSTVTLSGTAADAGGGVVAGVEVSTDGGGTWHRATGTTSWTYSWKAHGNPTANIKVRATDDSANIGTPGAGANINVSCPCSIWGSTTPSNVIANDNSGIEVGVKFKSDTYGSITGVRFWKVAGNTGSHTGSLWTTSGQRLAQATFTGESATGWQTVTFANPVIVQPNTTYIASYHAPNGMYAATSNYFYRDPAPDPEGGAINDSAPLHALRATGQTSNGVYTYSGTSTFPANGFGASNYWVDVTYQPIPPAGAVSNVTATAGRGSATVNWNAPSSGGAPSSYEVTPYIGASAQAVKTVTGSPPATSLTINGLTPGASYTFRVRAVNPNGAGPQSTASNAVTVLAPIAPSAPTAVSAEPISQSVRVSWTAPSSDGGSDLTGYTVTPYIGSTAQTAVPVGPSQNTVTVTGLTNGASYTFKVTATNAIGSTDSAASSAVVPQNTLFDLQTPQTVDGGDGSPVELGFKFRSDQYGTITGLRFYKAAANTGTHVGNLWTTSGTLLARATFTNESASGWQTVQFANPVQINANTTYVASYHAPNGHYSITGSAFNTPVDNAPLHALSNSVSPNGAYSYSGSTTFPDSSYAAANYWVDVTFLPTSGPGAVSGVSATAGRASATVNWTAPSSGGAPDSYEVTPYIGSTAQTAKTVNAPATSTTIKGLTAGTAYTFKVRATNPNGNGPQSSASNSITPLSAVAPDAPTGVQALAASDSARVTWTAPADDGGSALTGYTVSPSRDGVPQPDVDVSAGTTTVTLDDLSNGANYTFKVAAKNAIGSTQSAASAAVMPQQTVFDFATPAVIDGNDGSGVEVGFKFRSDQQGKVTGIRFYKAATNTGTHVGTLWSTGGSQLARATFTGESASGWQTIQFASPVQISANTTYVASYHAPNGHYSVTGQGFSSAVANPPLHGLSNTTTDNGVYAYNGTPTFPNNSWNATNYSVDVTFLATPIPGAVTGVTATAGNSSATVNWTAPATGGAPTSYEVTPYIGSTAQTPKLLEGSPLPTSTNVTGLNSGTAYTFKVRAANINGAGPLSSASNSVTPQSSSAPTAPTGVSAIAASKSARVSWTEPSNDGGSPLTGYTVTPSKDGAPQSSVAVAASNTSTTISSLTNGASYTFKVTATNASGSAESTASGAVTPFQTLFDFATPAIADGNDGSAVELGVKFNSSVAGSVTGLRFYKAAANTGTHVGTLWSAGGSQLARATFSGESASGWQTVTFTSPVQITPGTTYVASYHAPNGHYSVTGAAFTSAFDNPPLRALADSTSANGVYAYRGTPGFPADSWNATNYFVDVTFLPAP